MKNRPIPLSIIAISQGIIATVWIGFYTIDIILLGFNLYSLLYNISLLAFILLASFGLWKAKEWGWWLTNIYYIKILFGMVISIINSLYFVPKYYEGIENVMSNVFSPSAIIVIILGLLIPFYLFRKTVLDYFKIRNFKFKLAIIIIIALIWNLFPFLFSL